MALNPLREKWGAGEATCKRALIFGVRFPGGPKLVPGILQTV